MVGHCTYLVDSRVMLQCQADLVGYLTVPAVMTVELGSHGGAFGDGGLNYIFNRRTAPIAAALALTIDAPE